MKSGKMLTNIRKTCFHLPLAQQADRVVYLTMRLTNRNSVISLTLNSVCDIGWNSALEYSKHRGRSFICNKDRKNS